MRPKIRDEFTDLPISRQTRYKLRKRRDKRCRDCATRVFNTELCLKHLVQYRENQRKARGYRRRFTNALSYQLQIQHDQKW